MTMLKNNLFLRALCVGFWMLLLLSSSSLLAAEKVTQGEGQIEPLFNPAVSGKQKIRFYKANKQLQATSILLTDEKSSSSGCQNFLKKVKVFKVVQIGFASCTLYSEKECPAISSVAANSEDQAHTTTLLSEGIGWFPEGETDRGATIKSWLCDQAVDNDQVALENRNARREMARLNQEAKVMERKAEEAREKANKAKKAADKAKEYANRVKTYALATGAIEPDPEEDDEDSNGENSDKESLNADKAKN